MYKKKVTFTSNESQDGPKTKQVLIPKGNYQRIIESKSASLTTSQQSNPSVIQSANLRSIGSPDEGKKMNLSYSLSDIDENEMRDEFNDGVDSDLENKTSFNNFHQMDSGQKLYALAQRTQELKKKASDFDSKMRKLNDQFHFMDKY
ncbi:UNKNOWN [Stylonychia lemnae]|uniref:Uncharacterized protein n=1 Tax=Stylonychia lemnae TaxID=5949 RepID=A0A078A118_STYLE|nr:UNKNOWN [Stylonychia lemnae]|eukprot:CDW74474.1 UNKNOWN [Stylonychia lemnae]